MKKYRFLLMAFMICFPGITQAQKERKHIREGVSSYYQGIYPDAEVSFRDALEIDSSSIAAKYNMAGSLYKQGKYSEARDILNNIAKNNDNQQFQSDILHNIGNSFVKENDLQKAIEAYKNSLLFNPNDMDTKYNLAWAMKKQQQQQNQDKKNDQQKDQKDKQKDQNKDKDQQDQQNKKQEDEKKKQEQDQQQQQQKNNDQNKKKQPQQQQVKNLSKEDIKNMLEALQQQEKEVKEKVDKKKAKVAVKKNEKDW